MRIATCARSSARTLSVASGPRRSTGDTQYAFRHVLLRDVAYGQIPRRQRAQKHRRAGEWLEGLGRADDNAELLAHHYQHALELARSAGIEDDPELVRRACAALHAAGERATTLSAFQAAAEFFADALALSFPDDPERPRFVLDRARSLAVLGGAAPDLVHEALAGFRAAGDVEGQAEAATELARIAWQRRRPRGDGRLMSVALEAVRDRPASRARADALASQCGYLMLAGRFEESIEVGADALALVEELGLDDLRARVHILVGCARCCSATAAGFVEIESGIAIADAAGAVTMVILGLRESLERAHLLRAARRGTHCVSAGARHGRALTGSPPGDHARRGRRLGASSMAAGTTPWQSRTS